MAGSARWGFKITCCAAFILYLQCVEGIGREDNVEERQLHWLNTS